MFVWPRPGLEISLVKKTANDSLITHDIVILSVANVNFLRKIWCQRGRYGSPIAWFHHVCADSFWWPSSPAFRMEWHENLRKFSEIVGKFTLLEITQEITFIYNISISAIRNFAISHSSQIRYSHPCKPRYKHFISSFCKTYTFPCLLFISTCFRFLWLPVAVTS